jgi:hypothetical protein
MSLFKNRFAKGVHAIDFDVVTFLTYERRTPGGLADSSTASRAFCQNEREKACDDARGRYFAATAPLAHSTKVTGFA